jgi:hypothetical protein
MMGSDAPVGDKVAYVKRQGQVREHTCHWPGCDRQVPPALWGCKAHWYALPKALRDKIWRTYRVGQERTLTPSADYVAAAREVEAWIWANRAPAQPATPTQPALALGPPPPRRPTSADVERAPKEAAAANAVRWTEWAIAVLQQFARTSADVEQWRGWHAAHLTRLAEAYPDQHKRVEAAITALDFSVPPGAKRNGKGGQHGD